MNANSTDRQFGIPPSGFSLPAATRLGRARLQVSDLDQSINYYRDVLGLTVLKLHDRTASLGAHGSNRVLLELHERRGARPVPRGGRLGLYHFALLLPDRSFLGRLITRITHMPRIRFASADHLVSESIYLWDPDGLGIEVYADRPRDTWRTRGRELVMATEPLDIEAVVEAGAHQPWTGMPVGTVMGHMHLSVGDLTAASAFYHTALGFDAVVWSYPGALFLSAGGYHHHLGTNTWSAGARPATDDEAKLLEWELVVPHARDVEMATANIRSAGYDVTADAVATDPWGTQLRLTFSGSKAPKEPKSSGSDIASAERPPI